MATTVTCSRTRRAATRSNRKHKQLAICNAYTRASNDNRAHLTHLSEFIKAWSSEMVFVDLFKNEIN